MSTAILRTKLFVPPVRPGLVSRPRLIEQLNEGLHLQLTLVSAPAGFGKTTLLSEWACQIERPLAWISLDAGDSDPVRFLSYLIGALKQVDETFGQSAQGLAQSLRLQSGEPLSPMQAVETVVTALINDVSESDTPFALVLDDYHLIESMPTHYALQLLLEHQPPQMHLVISAREDPPVPLPRLRARGQVTEIREQDLRFTEAETAAFLDRAAGRSLSQEAVKTLETRTEGWVVGLQLAALSLKDLEEKDADAFIAAFAGDDRHVMDYLLEEVLSRQPDELQRFLLHTSVLNRLSAPLCDALVRDLELPDSSQAMLEQLDAANLFLAPLDNRREWYRYHRLFADLLRYRLRREWPERLAELDRRASRWYKQAGDPDEAVYHALAIPDFPLAVRVVEQYTLHMIVTSQIATYLDWIEKIPDDWVRRSACLCAGCGWAFSFIGMLQPAEEYVQAAERVMPDFEPIYIEPEGRWLTREELLGHLTVIRTNNARIEGDDAGVIAHSRQALRQLPVDAHTARCATALNLSLMYLRRGSLDEATGLLDEAFDLALRSDESIVVAVVALGLHGTLLAARGKLEEALGYYRRAIEMGSEASTFCPAVAQGYLGLANAHYQRNELDAAAEEAEKALALAKQAGVFEIVDNANLLHARLALIAADLSRVEALLEQAGEIDPSRMVMNPDGKSWTVIRGELLLARDEVGAAVQWAAERGLQAAEIVGRDPKTRIPWPKLSEGVLLARVLLAQGRVEDALSLLARLIAAAEAHQYAVVLLDATVLQAAARHLQNDNLRALQSLERALALAAPEGYLRPFLEAGEAMDKLLRRAIGQGVEVDHAKRALAALSAQTRAAGERLAPDDGGAEPLYEPLTERQQQVLRLLAEGLSSTEVAEELILAVSTVRSYIKIIYRKLNVHRRQEAIARGRQLGLI